MADSNDEKGKRSGARPAVPPFRGPASTPRAPLTPPAGIGQGGRSRPTPPAVGRTPFMPPPAGLRPRPATPAMPATPASPQRTVTPPLVPVVLDVAAAPAASRPQVAPAAPEPSKTPAWEPAVEAAESMPSVADFAPDAAPQGASQDPFSEWDEQLRDAQANHDAGSRAERAFAAGEEAASEPSHPDWSDSSFESLGDAGRALPKELAISSPLQPEVEVPEGTHAPFDATDGADAEEDPAEKVGLYGDSRAPLADDVVPATATGQPTIDALPPELMSSYPSLQDTAAYETFEAPRSTPESAIYAGEPADAWEAATAGESDHGARERAARLLERMASRVRSGEMHAPEVSAEAGDAATLAALLASMLGSTRERGA